MVSNTTLLTDQKFLLPTGGPESKGEITEVGTYSGGYYRGGVRVRWPHNPDKLVGYRTGAEGKVELKAVSNTKGGTFYPDHLPALGISSFFLMFQAPSQNAHKDMHVCVYLP